MGCQQSTPVDSSSNDAFRQSSGNGSAVKPKKDPNHHIKGIGATERLMSAQMKLMAASSSSGQPTVSLEADEEISSHMPKLKADGTLMPEEVVRRTSSSLTNSSIPIGNAQKDGGRLFQLEVRVALRKPMGQLRI